jgi:acetyl esterase/lipase
VTTLPSKRCYLKVLHGTPTDKFLLFFHGNAEDLGQTKGWVQPLMEATGMNALVAEYPGYGPNLSRERASVQTLQSYVQELCRELAREVKAEDLVVVGRSIGTGPACLASLLLRPRALVLVSGYTSLRAMVDFFVRVPYTRIPLLGMLTSPTRSCSWTSPAPSCSSTACETR